MFLQNLLKHHSSQKIGLILALIATVFYSLKPILIKLIYVYDVSSVNLLAWRVLISLPIYLAIGVFIWRQRKQSRRSPTIHRKWILQTIVLGAIGYYLAALLDLIGLQYISSQLARLILFTYPTLVALLAWLFFKQKISRTVFIALVLSYLGVGFIFTYDLGNLGDQVLFGSLMMFLSVLAFSTYVLFSKQLIDQVDGMSFTVVAMIASGVCVLIHFLLSSHTITGLAVSMPAFLLIAAMTILTTVIPSFLIAEAIALIGPQKTSIAGTIGPAVTSVFAVILLNEAFGISQFAGLVLVVVAITYMQRDQTRKDENTVIDY